MKTQILNLILGLFFIGTIANAQTIKTEKIKVSGNCGMCEKRIEKAAKSVDGVSFADWNKETKIIEVSLDEAKTSLENVEMVIAGSGHDTENKKAEDKVYDALPACCHYSRKEE